MSKQSEDVNTASMYVTLDDWAQHEAIPFSLESADSFNAAADEFMASLSDSVELLGLGEPTHGIEDFLLLRNRLFQRLVEGHGYSAIAIESSFPKTYLVNDYVLGHGPGSYEEIENSGFSHEFGKFKANRELVEWMRQYNADPSHQVKLHFYGFDSPTEVYVTDSPRQVLNGVLDYVASLDEDINQRYRQDIEALLGEDALWENPDAAMDPSKSIGLSPNAIQLRVTTEDLISELLTHRPEWIARSGKTRYQEALQFASVARQLLTYHATIARPSEGRYDRMANLRDTMMVDILTYIVSCERGRGKVLAFAHNSHLKRGKTEWQYKGDSHTWWLAGSHLNEMLGRNYVVIGTAIGVSEDNGLGQPEPGTIEAHLTASPGPIRLIPTYRGERLPESTIANLPTRSATQRYAPLTSQSLSDFDWLCILD